MSITNGAISSNNSFTANLSNDPARIRTRTTMKFCLLNLAPSSPLLDKLLGYLSVFTTGTVTVFVISGMVFLIPSVLLSKAMGLPSYFNNPNTNKSDNISVNSKTGSLTAVKTLQARTQMTLQQSGGPDHLAPILMSRLSLFGPGIPGSRLYTKLYMLLARWNFYLTGRIVSDVLAKYSPLEFRFGEAAFLQARTCWLDDCVETFVEKHTTTTTSSGRKKTANVNVVVLGAGYDSRCYRLNILKERQGVSMYEVDAPGTQSMKIQVLKETGVWNEKKNTTKFVSCDFESQDWLECLIKCGFDMNLPTIFIWEGVTMYITRDIFKSTLQKVALCGKHSCVGFDYLDPSWALSPQLVKRTKQGGEPWKFGMKEQEPEEIISECNKENNTNNDQQHASNELYILDHLKHKELIKRYLPKHFDGRPIGHLEDFGGFLLVGSR